jgi:hypothetical protein
MLCDARSCGMAMGSQQACKTSCWAGMEVEATLSSKPRGTDHLASTPHPATPQQRRDAHQSVRAASFGCAPPPAAMQLRQRSSMSATATSGCVFELAVAGM